MISIRSLNKVELAQFIESEEYKSLEYLPISKLVCTPRDCKYVS